MCAKIRKFIAERLENRHLLAIDAIPNVACELEAADSKLVADQIAALNASAEPKSANLIDTKEKTLLAKDDIFAWSEDLPFDPIDVLANDLYDETGQRPGIRLINAPEGAQVVRDGYVRLTKDMFDETGTLRFQYTLVLGEEKSTASVEIVRKPIPGPEILAEFSLRFTDEDSNTVDQLVSGQIYWLEFSGADKRDAPSGLFAGFFDLEVPQQNLTIIGPAENLSNFDSRPGATYTESEIDEVGGFHSDPESSISAEVAFLRIAVRAEQAGSVTLRPKPADEVGYENLLVEIDRQIPIDRVQYIPLEVTIVEETAADPMDANEDGTVDAIDALAVVNYLRRNPNSSSVDLQLESSSRKSGETPRIDVEAMRKLDTDKSGQVTALDALVVINWLRRKRAISSANISLDIRDKNQETETVRRQSENIPQTPIDSIDETSKRLRTKR
jgi:Dockerin type I domain